MNRSDPETVVLQAWADGLRAEGHDSTVVLRELRKRNAEERNPVSDEVLRDLAGAGQASSRAVVVTLADVEPQKVEYLWNPQIPRRKLTLGEGDGGVGKSFFFQAVGAAVSNGLVPGPDGKPAVRGKPETVLMLLAEDGIADTIRPRLGDMGADLNRIKILTGILTDGGELPLMLDEGGLQELDRTIEQEEPAYVLIDPIVQHLGSKVDMFRPNEVRAVLAPLMSMAQRHDCAIVMVRHLNKGSGGNATYRGQGSQDFYNAARSVLLFGLDPQDPKRSVMVHHKCNYAAKGPAQAFSIESGVFGWCGEVEMTANELLAVSDGSTHKDVLDLYDSKTGAPITAQMLVSELGMKPDAARQRLHRMWQSGQLEKPRHGEYLPRAKSDARKPVTVSQSSLSKRDGDKRDERDDLRGVTPACSECGSTDGRCKFDEELQEWVCASW
jgi:DNA repair protein RadA/Sms